MLTFARKIVKRGLSGVKALQSLVKGTNPDSRSSKVVRRVHAFTVIVTDGDYDEAVSRMGSALLRSIGQSNLSLELIVLVSTQADGNEGVELEWQQPADKVRLLRHHPADRGRAVTAAIRAARGSWIGFSTSTSSCSEGFFRAMVLAMLARPFDASAIVTNLVLGSATPATGMNPAVKGRKYVEASSQEYSPYLDAQNVFFAKAVIDQCAGPLLDASPRWLENDGITLVARVLGQVGNIRMLLVPEAVKTIEPRHGNFGAKAFPHLAKNHLFQQAVAEVMSPAFKSTPLPLWLQVRAARAALVVVEELAARRTVGDVPVNGNFAALDGRLQEVFDSVDYETIESLRPEVAKWPVRQGALVRYKGIFPLRVPVHVDEVDLALGQVRLKWSIPYAARTVFSRGGVVVNTIIHKETSVDLCGALLYFENIAWIPAFELDRLVVTINGQSATLYIKGKKADERFSSQLVGFDGTPPMAGRRNIRQRIIRHLATSDRIRQKYDAAWLFIDKDNRADDNAEHFYRWVLRNVPERSRAFFVLRRDSADWRRLEAEGFKLLAFGTLQHYLALLNAEWLFSSHAAPFVVSVLPRTKYGDLLRYKFCFLQHGVTKDDISGWLNSRKIHLLVTAASAEMQSMSSGNYNFTEREVKLTGFPRHDALVQKRKDSPRRIVLMPTWRLSLAGPLIGKTSSREKNPAFKDSRFFSAWNSLLSDNELLDRITTAGFDVVFIPHPNLKPYLPDFKIDGRIMVADIDSISIQEYLADCAFLLTDYSSISFELAYIRRPVAYFQFDREEFFSSHSYKRGYYDYDRDGFGPVFTDEVSLRTGLVDMAAQGFPLTPMYEARMSSFFAFDDAENSKRLYAALRGPGVTQLGT